MAETIRFIRSISLGPRPSHRHQATSSLQITVDSVNFDKVVFLESGRDARGPRKDELIPLHPTALSVLNVLMQQFDLITLFADFDAQQVTHREHANPALAVNHRQVARPNQLHSLQRLMRSLIAVDYRS
jgi:hypothetical protein